MAAADFEAIFYIAKGDLVAVVIGMHTGKRRQVDQRVAVDAHKAVAELGLQ